MKILKKKILTDIPGIKITEMELLSPDIAAKAKPGEFIVFMLSKVGERVPLTIVNADKAKGTLTIIFQEAGLTTKLLGQMKEGDSLYALVGPLGHATQIKKYGKVILVGGGVGIAEILPVAKALKDAGNHVVTILGARNKDALILEQELKNASSEIFVTTDD